MTRVLDTPAMRKRALITGIAGQDGSYLAELLLSKGYEVHGLEAQLPATGFPNLAGMQQSLTLHRADVGDSSALNKVLTEISPEEIYNLAAPSFVPSSWNDPVPTAELTAIAVTKLLDAVRKHLPSARVFQASSSELFGRPSEAPQTEATPIDPRSPYGAAKAYAHFMVRTFRESHGLFAASGILYNHESPRRRPEFVVRKVTQGAARIKRGLQDRLSMGNLDARRDWGFAGDYVDAMWRMLQAETPDDYVIATGEARSVQTLCELAFAEVGLDWRDHVVVDPAFVRAGESHQLVGSHEKAKRQLGWEPRMRLEDLVRSMVQTDLAIIDRAGG